MKHRLATLTSLVWLLSGCGTEVRGDGTGAGGEGSGTGGDGTGGDSGTGGRAVGCSEPAVSGVFEPGAYFFVVDIEKPLPTQLQLLAWFDVDAETGVVTVRFTNADRSPGPTCGCAADDACSSVDPARCVLPSTKAGSEEEYVDFLVANDSPPEGYSFTTTVCTFDQPDGTVTFTAAPVDIVIAQPEVTLVAARLRGQLVVEGEGVLRGSGSFEAERVLLGTADAGPALGTLATRTIPADEVPADVPKP